MIKNTAGFDAEYRYWKKKLGQDKLDVLAKYHLNHLKKRQANKYNPHGPPVDINDCMKNYKNFKLFITQKFRQRTLIMGLLNKPPIPQSEYKEVCKIDQSNYNMYIKEFEETGILERKLNPDGKGHIIWLSEKVKKFVNKCQNEGVI